MVTTELHPHPFSPNSIPTPPPSPQTTEWISSNDILKTDISENHFEDELETGNDEIGEDMVSILVLQYLRGIR